MNVTIFLKRFFYWLGMYALYVCIILGVGAICGVVLAPVLWFVFRWEVGGVELFLKGASIGFRYAGVWAGGAAIVLCFMKAYKRHEKSRKCCRVMQSDE